MKKTVLEPKYWQMALGFPLARLLNRVIHNSGFANKVEVVSFPHEGIYQILVFRLASFGEPIHKGTERRGIEFLRVGIKFPDQFNITLYDADGEGTCFSFPSAGILVKNAEETLTEILCTFWLEANP